MKFSAIQEALRQIYGIHPGRWWAQMSGPVYHGRNGLHSLKHRRYIVSSDGC